MPLIMEDFYFHTIPKYELCIFLISLTYATARVLFDVTLLKILCTHPTNFEILYRPSPRFHHSQSCSIPTFFHATPEILMNSDRNCLSFSDIQDGVPNSPFETNRLHYHLKPCLRWAMAKLASCLGHWSRIFQQTRQHWKLIQNPSERKALFELD